MTRPIRPEVSDPKLRATLDHVGPHIESYNANLDLISKDIKSIENYLSNSGIRHAASTWFRRQDVFPEGQAPDELDNYSGTLYRVLEMLEWSADQAGRWRLFYVKSRQEGFLELCERIAIVGPSFNGPIEELERKPLIEASATIRLEAHKHLSELVYAIGKLVKFKPMVQPLTDEDIPF